MDAVSYSLASKQAQRIEKFIANPDSSSGIVTVPKVIASGETITIPAGRVAVLPNVVVDGTLNIDGEVFIPSGATFGDLDAQLALKAPLVNPAFTNPTATTQAAQDNSTKVATTAYVDGKMVLGTAVTASGTAIDFTSIPSWVKRITVMFNGVSTNGSSPVQIQLGDSGGIENSGYLGSTGSMSGSSVVVVQHNTGIILTDAAGAIDTRQAHLVFTLLNSQTWSMAGVSSLSSTPRCSSINCTKTLSATLDRIRVTTVNGTDIFDSGQINIMYEG